jgi:DNA-binding transcriptional regulator YhcF (GntR family)
MKGADLEKIQRMLVKEGYLKTPKQYGVFTVESELAYDAWDSAQLQKRNEAYMNELRAKVAEKEAAEAEFEKSLTWFQKLMRYLKSFF